MNEKEIRMKCIHLTFVVKFITTDHNDSNSLDWIINGIVNSQTVYSNTLQWLYAVIRDQCMSGRLLHNIYKYIYKY